MSYLSQKQLSKLPLLLIQSLSSNSEITNNFREAQNLSKKSPLQYRQRMVWNSIKNAIGLGDPLANEPSGPTRLPQYFPVEPKGCEKQTQKLFNCLSNEATAKLRDMERVGFHKSYFPDVEVSPMDPKAAEAVAQNPENPEFPKAGDNPLDECKLFIAHYRRCCDRNLKQKRNQMLRETVRVHEEYRYTGPEATEEKS